jgi:hypothetical protein
MVVAIALDVSVSHIISEKIGVHMRVEIGDSVRHEDPPLVCVKNETVK